MTTNSSAQSHHQNTQNPYAHEGIMKNKHIEQLKQQAKLYHRHSRSRHFEDGIVVRHLYDSKNPQKLTWWDDVIFILNDYLVNVAWTHPRFAYQGKVENMAYAACAYLQNSSAFDLLDDSSPNYQKVGKSRKKIVSYTMKQGSDDAYFAALREEETRIAHEPENGINIVPGIATEWTNWSRFVSMCAPIEVRGIADLRELATLTKRILKQETSLAQEFPSYAYTQQNWTAEFQNHEEVSLLSHAVKS